MADQPLGLADQGFVGGDIHQRGAAGAGTGESDRLDDGVLDDGLADFAPAAVEDGEDALRHAGRTCGADDGAGDDFGNAGVGLVGDDDDRAAGGKG